MYEPQVDDYVVWERPNGDIDEGWVYFKGDVPEVKKGFPTNPRYITIETGIKPNQTVSMRKMIAISLYTPYCYVMRVSGKI